MIFGPNIRRACQSVGGVGGGSHYASQLVPTLPRGRLCSLLTNQGGDKFQPGDDNIHADVDDGTEGTVWCDGSLQSKSSISLN